MLRGGQVDDVSFRSGVSSRSHTIEFEGNFLQLVGRFELHAALTTSFQSAPASGGARMRHSRPALTQRAWHAAAAASPARSASAKMVKLSMPGSTGNLSMDPDEPQAQTGRQP